MDDPREWETLVCGQELGNQSEVTCVSSPHSEQDKTWLVGDDAYSATDLIQLSTAAAKPLVQIPFQTLAPPPPPFLIDLAGQIETRRPLDVARAGEYTIRIIEPTFQVD